MQRIEVERTITPKTAKMPNLVHLNSLRILICREPISREPGAPVVKRHEPAIVNYGVVHAL